MAARHIAAGSVTLAIILACGGHSEGYPKSTALFERGEAADWYIADRGSFYPLHGELDRYGLPKLGTPTPIDGSSHYFVSLTVSPDGALLAGLTYPFGGDSAKTHLVVFNEDLEVVYENPELLFTSHIRWSPDGRYIASYHASPRSFELSVLDWETKELRAVATDTRKRGRNTIISAMSWSPDSNRLAYETADDHIVVRTLEGEEIARWPGYMPAWDPAGERIVHRSKGSRTDRRRVSIYDLQSHKSRVLFSQLVADQLFWTPDGRFLLFRQRWVNTSMGQLHFYDPEADQVFRTGKELPSTRHAQVIPLPAGVRDRLSLFTNNDTENPNRRSAAKASDQ